MAIFNQEQEKLNITSRIIAFEGVDGTGKSTAIKLASKFLKNLEIPHLVTQELSGTKQQLEFRQMLMKCETPMDELLVVSLARRWHRKNILLPALQKGQHVLMDRFMSSTWAYQGQYLKSDLIEIFEKEVWQVPAPNLTIYFQGECLREVHRDRFEQKDKIFFDRAREIYQNRASSAPQKIMGSELYMQNEGKDAESQGNNLDSNLSILDGSWLFVKAGQQLAINRAILCIINKKNKFI